MQNFRALGVLSPDPRASGGWGLSPHTPKTAHPNCEFLATRQVAARTTMGCQIGGLQFVKIYIRSSRKQNLLSYTLK